MSRLKKSYRHHSPARLDVGRDSFRNGTNEGLPLVLSHQSTHFRLVPNLVFLIIELCVFIFSNLFWQSAHALHGRAVAFRFGPRRVAYLKADRRLRIPHFARIVFPKSKRKASFTKLWPVNWLLRGFRRSWICAAGRALRDWWWPVTAEGSSASNCQTRPLKTPVSKRVTIESTTRNSTPDVWNSFSNRFWNNWRPHRTLPSLWVGKINVNKFRIQDIVTFFYYLSERVIRLLRDRDNRRLKSEPFYLRKATPVDMFPHTDHCEMILSYRRWDLNTKCSAWIVSSWKVSAIYAKGFATFVWQFDVCFPVGPTDSTRSLQPRFSNLEWNGGQIGWIVWLFSDFFRFDRRRGDLVNQQSK